MRMLLFVLLASLPGAVPAAGPRVSDRATAYIDWRHDAQDYVIIDEDLWRCEKDRCSGPLVDSGFMPRRACRKLHWQAGNVRRLVLPKREFTEAELKECNR